MDKWKPWAAFLFLGGLAWGTSFLWIKIALEEIGPFTLVAYRVGFGCLTVWILMWLLRLRLAPSRGQLRIMILLGLIYTAIPFVLISWAEKHIDSGIAGILNGSMPLFTMLIAHWTLPDDRITIPKAIGLITGLVGLALLVIRDIRPEGLAGSLWGQLAVVGAAICYAVGVVLIRSRLKGMHSVPVAAVALSVALVVALAAALIVEHPFAIPRHPRTWLACSWMGILSTGLSYLAGVYLIHAWGATRSALVTYLFPVTAVALGIIFFGERPSWQELAGGVLVIGGIALVNARPASPQLIAREPKTASDRGEK
ncbi:DMT family transporter [bacterium]|nr:DMT family transporter [bacterium]MBU1985262.1 DMT family transporter [bacterium]